jgi:hypothetical protein
MKRMRMKMQKKKMTRDQLRIMIKLIQTYQQEVITTSKQTQLSSKQLSNLEWVLKIFWKM